MPGSLSSIREPRQIGPDDARRASRLVRLIGDPIRLRVVSELTLGERTVDDLSDLLGLDLLALGHHLALLSHGNLIAPRRHGKDNVYHLTEAGVNLAGVVNLLLGESELEPTAIGWEEIHAAVQFTLEGMAERASWGMPPIRSVPGSTTGRSFPLFSYRIFYAPEAGEIDPIVVGLLFEFNGENVSINGDVGGESSGSMLYGTEPRSVPATHRAVRDAALAMAEELSGRLDVVRAGLGVSGHPNPPGPHPPDSIVRELPGEGD